MKKFFGIIFSKKHLLSTIFVLLGVVNAIFYTIKYYEQSGLEFNQINTFSINWNIVFLIVITALCINNNITAKALNKNIKKNSETMADIEDNIISDNRDTKDMIIMLIKHIKKR